MDEESSNASFWDSCNVTRKSMVPTPCILQNNNARDGVSTRVETDPTALLPKQLFLHVSHNSLSFVSIAFPDDGAQRFPSTRFKGDKM
jgi:hypothetical protein